MSYLAKTFVLMLLIKFSHQICTNNNIFFDIKCWSVSTPEDINITSDFCNSQNIPPYYRRILKINASSIPTLTKKYFQNFAGCQIVNVEINNCDVKEISAGTFDVFEKLQVINLSKNKIKVFRNGIFDKNQHFGNLVTPWKIRTLILESNGLELIEDDALDNLKNLTFLNLRNNSLSTIPSIEKWSMLSRLDLSNNNFESINIKHPKLSSIHLHKNKLKYFHFSSLDCPRLSDIDLSFNNLSKLNATDNSLEQIYMLNISHNSINHLKISKNLALLDWSYNGLRFISTNLFENASRLASINLSGNNITYLDSDIFFNMSYLSILNLSDNELHSLSYGFINQKGLTSLDLSKNQLRTKDLDILYKLKNLKVLFLHSNRIDDILVYKLPPYLHIISIHDNKFKSCEKMCNIINQLKSREVKIAYESLLYKEVINGDVCYQCSNITNDYLAEVLKNLTKENKQEYQIVNDKLNRLNDLQEKNLLNVVSLELKFVLALLVIIILLLLIINRKSIFSCAYKENKSNNIGDHLTSLVQ